MSISLDKLFFYPDFSCNLRCHHCYLAGLRPTVYSNEMLDKLIEIVGNNHIGQLRIAGGEPTLVPNLPQFIKQVNALNVEAQLMTNGQKLDEASIDALAEYPFNGIWFSLYGATPSTNAKVSGTTSSFGKTLDSISKSVRAGLTVGLSILLLTHTFSEVEDLRTLAAGLGVNALKFLVATPPFRSPSIMSKLIPSHAHMQYTIRALRSAFCGMNWLTIRYPTLEPSTCLLLSGKPLFSVTGDGYVVPCCLSVGMKGHRIGNVLETPLEAIVAGYFGQPQYDLGQYLCTECSEDDKEQWCPVVFTE